MGSEVPISVSDSQVICPELQSILSSYLPFFVFLCSRISSKLHMDLQGLLLSSHRCCQLKKLKTKPTMTGGGRINWAGEEHFGYSRPSGPCLDRTFNAIVSMFVGCFPSAVAISTELPLFCWSCPWESSGETQSWRRPFNFRCLVWTLDDIYQIW